MYVKAAINGGRPRTETCLVPSTPRQIAEESQRCVDLGANVVHAHARDAEGKESIHPSDIAAMVTATKNLNPDIIIGTTTGLWTCESHTNRIQLLNSWSADARPDFASITYREEGADEVAELILELGMQLESAVWSYDDVPKLLASPFLHNNVRILIEPETKDVASALQMCLDIKSTFGAAGVKVPMLFHGYDNSFWPIVELAIKEKVQTRIGFEDTDTTSEGALATTNSDLFASYHRMLERLSL